MVGQGHADGQLVLLPRASRHVLGCRLEASRAATGSAITAVKASRALPGVTAVAISTVAA